MKLQKIVEKSFSRYGRVLGNISTEKIREVAGTQEMPQDGVAYERSITKLGKPAFVCG